MYYRLRSHSGLFLALLATAPVLADSVEELRVVDRRERVRIELADSVKFAPDATAYLRAAPGGDVNGNGPLTLIPQYRGMYGARISVSVNGAAISSGGPNWMDPPLSYAPAAMLESLEIYRGIAPVSAGQETIGGAINATTWTGDFMSSDTFSSSGRVSVGAQSVNEASLISAMTSLANRQHRFKLAVMAEQANDAEFPEGEVTPSEYERERFDVGYGFTSGRHTIQLDAAHNETGESGTPALPMDIDYIDSDLASLTYRGEAAAWALEAKIFYSDIEHGMTNYLLREAPAAANRWRRNTATGDNLGFKISGQINDGNNRWILGIDGTEEVHNSDIDNPNNPMFFVTNFNDASREIFGIFVERKQEVANNLRAEFGLRYNRVEMSADQVDATPAMMMVPAATLRNQFNQAQRKLNDDNIDWVAKFNYQYTRELGFYLGAARKSRSPSYQERYLWLPLEATAGLADGRTYAGNPDLDPEVAHEAELGFDYASDSFVLSPRVFYREVDDFIQGTVSGNSAAVMFVSMMNMMNSTNNPEPLEFNNVEARFFGLDLDWRYQLSAQWSASGLLNIVHGEREDIDDNLYRIAPVNMTVALTYQSSQWALTVESLLYDGQNKVSETNGEQKTAGYGLLNVNGYWQIAPNMRLGAGIDNVLDKHYQDHLSGYNRAVNDDVAIGERLPGYGRNAFLKLDYQW